MPALSSTPLFNTLIHRAANTTGKDNALQVVCAWPVSGQYGPGSRVLYYVLVAACVFARKSDWLRNACLAAALLFPAVAALHGIVLASLHVNGAVDMDVYGAFQLCSIGILAAPVTVRLSRTYFFDPGRNTIFIWTGLILAGLLSLTVEFYRATTHDCTHDDSGNPISPHAALFPYTSNITCGLVCSTFQGPYSPMRRDAANNIYVIPAPDKLTFGMATLLAAACCIPAILSLIFMWTKILEINWKTRFGSRDEDDDPIAGTNGATIGKMDSVNNMVRLFLSVVEVPVFLGAVLAILALGERNFFSYQVRYQTEPIQSVGQWAPIVGTGLAALGSLYLLLAADVEAVKEEVVPPVSMHHCNCSHHHDDGERVQRFPTLHIDPGEDYPQSSRGDPSIDGDVFERTSHDPIERPAMHEVGRGLFTASSHSVTGPSATEILPDHSNELGATASRPTLSQGHQDKHSSTIDLGNRRKVAKTLTAIGNRLGSAAHDWFDDSEFKRGKALDFPEIPGEEHRNRALPRIREQYNQRRDEYGNVTPALHAQRSRGASFTSSIASGLGIERDTNAHGATVHPQSPRSPQSPPSFPVPTTPRTPPDPTLPAIQTSGEVQNPAPSQPSSPAGYRPPIRRDTLEVPSSVRQGSSRNHPPSPSASAVMSQDPSESPVVSKDSDEERAEGRL